MYKVIKKVWAGVFKGAQHPLGEGVAENGVVELVETTPVGARGRLSPSSLKNLTA